MRRERLSHQSEIDSVMLFPRDTDLSEKSVTETYECHEEGGRYSTALEKFIQALNGNFARNALSRSECASEISDVFNGLRERAARERFSDADVQMRCLDGFWLQEAELDAAPRLDPQLTAGALQEGAWADLDLGYLADDENVKAFLAELPSLLAEGHRSKFAAFARGKLVGIDADFEPLRKRVERSHPDDSILIQQIDTCPPQVQLSSPKLL